MNTARCQFCQERIAGKVLSYLGGNACESCYAQIPPAQLEAAAARQQEVGSLDAPHTPTAQPSGSAELGSSGTCVALGVLSLAVGLYFLIVAPGESVSMPGAYGLPGPSTQVVNLQRLAIGQALTIVGSVFLAAAVRPRR